MINHLVVVFTHRCIWNLPPAFYECKLLCCGHAVAKILSRAWVEDLHNLIWIARSICALLQRWDHTKNMFLAYFSFLHSVWPLGYSWIPQPKLHRACYLIFFVKPQNGLVWPFLKYCREKVLSRFLSELWALIELNWYDWDELTRTRVMSVNWVCWNIFSAVIEESMFRNNLSLVCASTILSSSRGSAWLT